MTDEKKMRVQYAGVNFGKSEEMALRLAEKVIEFVRQGGETVTIEVVTSDIQNLLKRVEALEKKLNIDEGTRAHAVIFDEPIPDEPGFKVEHGTRPIWLKKPEPKINDDRVKIGGVYRFIGDYYNGPKGLVHLDELVAVKEFGGYSMATSKRSWRVVSSIGLIFVDEESLSLP